MAFLDDVFNGWGTTTLVGLGVVVAAPLLLPTVGALVRPVAKGLIKSGLFSLRSEYNVYGAFAKRRDFYCPTLRFENSRNVEALVLLLGRFERPDPHDEPSRAVERSGTIGTAGTPESLSLNF